MILSDYSAFVGSPPIVLVDTPEAIRCLATTTDHLAKALRFLAATDTLSLEVVFNVETQPVDGGPTTECLACSGVGCAECRQRGFTYLDSHHAVQVVGDDLSVRMLFVTIPDSGVPELSAPMEVITAQGALLDALKAVKGIPKKRDLMVEDLIQVARAEGWADVWR